MVKGNVGSGHLSIHQLLMRIQSVPSSQFPWPNNMNYSNCSQKHDELPFMFVEIQWFFSIWRLTVWVWKCSLTRNFIHSPFFACILKYLNRKIGKKEKNVGIKFSVGIKKGIFSCVFHFDIENVFFFWLSEIVSYLCKCQICNLIGSVWISKKKKLWAISHSHVSVYQWFGATVSVHCSLICYSIRFYLS